MLRHSILLSVLTLCCTGLSCAQTASRPTSAKSPASFSRVSKYPLRIKDKESRKNLVVLDGAVSRGLLAQLYWLGDEGRSWGPGKTGVRIFDGQGAKTVDQSFPHHYDRRPFNIRIHGRHRGWNLLRSHKILPLHLDGRSQSEEFRLEDGFVVKAAHIFAGSHIAVGVKGGRPQAYIWRGKMSESERCVALPMQFEGKGLSVGHFSDAVFLAPGEMILSGVFNRSRPDSGSDAFLLKYDLKSRRVLDLISLRRDRQYSSDPSMFLRHGRVLVAWSNFNYYGRGWIGDVIGSMESFGFHPAQPKFVVTKKKSRFQAGAGAQDVLAVEDELGGLISVVAQDMLGSHHGPPATTGRVRIMRLDENDQITSNQVFDHQDIPLAIDFNAETKTLRVWGVQFVSTFVLR